MSCNIVCVNFIQVINCRQDFFLIQRVSYKLLVQNLGKKGFLCDGLIVFNSFKFYLRLNMKYDTVYVNKINSFL